jgi:hypothetical protein
VGKKKNGRAPRQCAPLIAARGGGSQRLGSGNRGRKQRWQQPQSDVGARSGHRRSDNATDKRVPHYFTIIQIIQNRLKLVKLKWVPYIALKILKFFMTLYWSVVNNFLNCSDFKFTTELMLKILEQIQCLKPL